MPLASLDPSQYESQFTQKIAQFQTDFASFNLPAPAQFRSPVSHYRLRAEFRLWHHGDELDYAMFDPENPKRPVLMKTFPVACKLICDIMPRLKEKLMANPILRQRVYAVDFLATLSGDLLITLIYHRKLDSAWESEARQLAANLPAKIIGRSRGQKITLDCDYVIESFDFRGRPLQYQQFENSFTQPNGMVNQQMLGWACDQAAELGGDLLELYCGNGNFTLALAPLFERVLATEVSKSSVQAALYNLNANQISNTKIVRLASEEISAALAGTESFKRLQDISLADYRFSTLFVDPPRSGLDPATLNLARQFDNILYISCNPQTLHENVQSLQSTHMIHAAAAFDQFPYTHHLECGLLLKRRSSSG